MFIFVVKPLGTCRGWGASRSVALLSAPPEAHVRGTREGPQSRWHLTALLVGGFLSLGPRGGVHRRRGPGGPLEGMGTRFQRRPSGRVSGPSRGSPQLRRPRGIP
ncbi:unnamed protein product [Pleuronectes platessa]|uniref:Uncharacterized protein n=1 Tax=Pleuronectes platessa TaxID=8262 RepID=A0A9N7ZA54_PLEPL|nr:unnamed protein product [Pleuronectes platessa]